jgi:hypothetical protein
MSRDVTGRITELMSSATLRRARGRARRALRLPGSTIPRASTVGVGAHSVSCRRAALYEPHDSLLVHHFRYREEQATRARLAALCGVDGGPDTRVGYQELRQRESYGAGLGIVERVRKLDRVYAQARGPGPPRPTCGGGKSSPAGARPTSRAGSEPSSKRGGYAQGP